MAGGVPLLSVDSLRIAVAERSLVAGSNFAISAGEMLALVGESGSGKSLTALAIMQLLGRQFTASGAITFEGKPLSGLSEGEMRRLRGCEISMIFQEPMTALNPLHTIEKQIKEVLSLHQPNLVNPRSRVVELLGEVGLSHLENRLNAYPHELSGGERQRVMIAMAIANNPKLLIADEPTTAVDVTVQAKILELLKRLQRERGMAMLFITHDLHVVKHMADRVAVMQRGEIVEQGTVADVFAAPKHAYTKALLASEPKGSAVPVPADAKPLMEAQDVAVSFPIKRGVFKRTVGFKHALMPTSFGLKTGETLGVVGESGSGKTTLAFALLRMNKASGRIVFLGKNLSELEGKALLPFRKEMQLVFQDPFGSLNPRMSVGEIIAEGLHVHGLSASVEEMLEQVGLSADMATRYPHEFSGGQRQRISLARALILKPKMLILDEPTSALDVTVQCQIIDLLKEFQAKYGIAMMVISHDLRVVRALAHHIIVLKAGEVVEAAPTEKLFAQPSSDYTRALMRAAWLE